MRNLANAMCLFALAMILFACAEANTRYSRADLPNRFKDLKIDDSVERLYEILGPPLFVDVNSDVANYGGARMESLGRTDLQAVSEYTTYTNHALRLTYSDAKSIPPHSFVLYIVEVYKGKVRNINGPSYQD